MNMFFLCNSQDMIPSEVLAGVFDFVALFARHEFFTKKLYKQVKCDVDTNDEAEVFIAFLCNILYTKGIYVTPCGSAWCHVWNNKQLCETYREQWMPVYQAYTDWQLKQR